MKDRERPDTIENRWDILYRDYPEVYDKWTEILEKPTIPEVLNMTFNLKDMVILDIGSGTGKKFLSKNWLHASMYKSKFTLRVWILF